MVPVVPPPHYKCIARLSGKSRQPVVKWGRIREEYRRNVAHYPPLIFHLSVRVILCEEKGEPAVKVLPKSNSGPLKHVRPPRKRTNNCYVPRGPKSKPYWYGVRPGVGEW